MRLKRKCLICGKPIRSALTNKLIQEFTDPPADAVVFTASGNFGSKVFDSVGYEQLEIIVCDHCLTTRSDHVTTVFLNQRNLIDSIKKGIENVE